MTGLLATIGVAVLVLTFIGLVYGGVKWLFVMGVRIKEMVASLERVERLSQELGRNGGSSLADAVHRIERRLDVIEKWMIER